MEQNQATRFPIAYVAFGGKRNHWIPKLLKKGFSHCFIILGDGTNWVLIDPVIGYNDMISLKGKRVFEYLKEKKFTLVKTTIDYKTKRPFHLRPLTCVEIVKGFLCINNPFIFTPYQLYKYLIKKEWEERKIK